MLNQFGNTLDPSSDIYEIGLLAATSPEFMQALMKTFLETDADSKIAAMACQPSVLVAVDYER